MKKALLLSVATGIALSSFAQSKFVNHGFDSKTLATTPARGNSTHRTTATQDTLFNIIASDTASLYYYPSAGQGFASGMNSNNINAYAERFDFNPSLYSIQVLGVIPIMGSTVDAASTDVVTFKVWSQGAHEAASATLTYNGLPNTLLDSVNVPYTSLGIGAGGVLGSNSAFFATPTAYLTDSFFVGYSLNYTWGSTGGDTIAIATSRQDKRHSPVYSSAVVGDTLVNDQNAFMFQGFWFDLGHDLGLRTNLWIFPIVNVNTLTTGIEGTGISNQGFTFYNVYPNPAAASTNVKYALGSASNVHIAVMDMTGRTVNKIQLTNQAAGEHVANVNTANLAAGDYTLLIRAENGGGIATKITVIK